MKKKFKNEKPNPDDYKGMNRAAKGVKGGLGLGGILVSGVLLVKKHGKDIVKIGKTLLHK